MRGAEDREEFSEDLKQWRMGHVSISSRDKSRSKSPWNGKKSGAIGTQKGFLDDDHGDEVWKKTKGLEYHSKESRLCSVVKAISSDFQMGLV